MLLVCRTAAKHLGHSDQRSCFVAADDHHSRIEEAVSGFVNGQKQLEEATSRIVPGGHKAAGEAAEAAGATSSHRIAESDAGHDRTIFAVVALWLHQS